MFFTVLFATSVNLCQDFHNCTVFLTTKPCDEYLYNVSLAKHKYSCKETDHWKKLNLDCCMLLLHVTCGEIFHLEIWPDDLFIFAFGEIWGKRFSWYHMASENYSLFFSTLTSKEEHFQSFSSFLEV